MQKLLIRWVLSSALFAPGVAQAVDQSTQHFFYKEGRKLDLHISKQFEPDVRANLLAWIEFLSDSLAQVYGHWPRQHWQVSIAPASGAGDDPIPWAQVHRGEPDRVEFFTVSRASEEQLKHAWTGYHEFAHLLIPYRGWGDAWFSEGLASYYQNIMQVRAGVLSEDQMWQKLYEGYQRGLRESKFDGRTLQSVSDNLRREGGFMRVYWSGAWYFLVADTRLRQLSGGKLSLDKALGKLNACCAEQSLSVPEMVQKLDELNATELFRPLYDEALASTRTPAFEPVFADLGIEIVNGRVRLQRVKGATLRRQIVSGAVL